MRCVPIRCVQEQSAKGASASLSPLAAALEAAADAKSISMDELKDLLKANNLDHTGLKQQHLQQLSGSAHTAKMTTP